MAVKALMTDETGKQIVDAIREKAGLEERVSDLEKNKVDKSSIAQTTGTAEDKVISQRAVTEELEKKFDKSNVVQSTGDAEDKVMSQAAATKEFGKLSEEIDNISESTRNIFDKRYVNVMATETDYYYIDESNGRLRMASLSSGSPRIIYVGIDANTTYTISKDIASIMRVCTVPNVPTTSTVTPTAYAVQKSATTEPIGITSGENDTILCVQLFVDTDSVISLAPYYDTLQIEEGSERTDYIESYTAVDHVAREMAAPKLNAYNEYNKENVLFFGVNTIQDYFRGNHSEYDSAVFNATTKAEAFLLAFDALLDVDGSYITKKALASGAKTLYEYDLTPNTPTIETGKAMPKILIVCGQHGGEKAAICGLYYAVKDLVDNADSPIVEYLRNNVVLKIIPVANPDGINANTYTNANGVNLNRNYATKGWSAYESGAGTIQYKGPSAESEDETKIISNFVRENTDAFLLIDYHNGGGTSVGVEYNDNINWHDYPKATEDYTYYMRNLSKYHIRRITPRFVADYGVVLGADRNARCGKITGGKGTPTGVELEVFAYEQGIMAMTFEGFSGFPNATPYTDDVLKANEELIVNWLMVVCNEYIKR